MAKQSLAERIRSKMNSTAKESKESKGNPLEWTPPVGTTRIRILPPKNEDDDFFYATHSFHYMPKDISKIGTGEKVEGSYLWTRKFYEVDSKGKTLRKKDPIDEAVAEWYDLGRKNDDKEMFELAGTLKRKRNYFFNVIVITRDEETGEDKFEYKVLVDRSNEGKLARFICRKMGVAFFRDIEDKWVDKDSDVFDENDEFFDLIDMDNGHDIKIIKTQVGKKNWDVSYDTSVVVRKPRPLTDEERELAEQAVDLQTYIAYEEDYNVVKKALEKLIGDEDESDDEDSGEAPVKETGKKPASRKVQNDEEDDEDGGDEDEEIKPANKATAGNGKAPSKSYSKPAKTEVSDDEFEEMLGELDEDEEE